MMGVLLLMGVVLFLLLQAIEIWRRHRHPEELTPQMFWRRMLTAAALELVLLMWLVGDRLMASQRPLTQLAYWSALLFLGIAAAFAAAREMGEVSRQYHRRRSELFRGADGAGGRRGEEG
jgi:hypothetical protein